MGVQPARYLYRLADPDEEKVLAYLARRSLYVDTLRNHGVDTYMLGTLLMGSGIIGAGEGRLCTDTLELIQPWRKVTEEIDMLYILGENCGKLLVSDRRRRVYLADLETGTVEAVSDWHSLHPNIPLDVVPLEMDWTAFFFSRLGTARYIYVILCLICRIINTSVPTTYRTEDHHQRRPAAA